MNKFLLLLLVFILPSNHFRAQTTEDFETEPVGSPTFINNNQVFSINSQGPALFDVIFYAGAGWNGTSADNRFIDNSGSTYFNTPVQFSISSVSAFTLKSFYLFLSTSSLNLNGSGSLTITGKLGSVEKFTATVNSPFNTSLGINNGFTFINMKTFGGTDNSNVPIDEFVIKTSGNIAYVSLDAMTWDKPVCKIPSNVTISNVISDKATVNWADFGTYDLEWGKKDFTPGLGTKQNGVSALNYQITGLTESTSYDVYVRKNCTYMQSNWVKHTFSTIAQCPPGNMTFTSQAQLNDFKSQYPNCTQISGDLVIQGNDITDVSPLNKIQNIGGYLLINSNPQLTNVDGLSALATVTTNIGIWSNPKLTNVDGFASLTSIGGFLGIQANILLDNLDGFSNVTNLGADFVLLNNASIKSISGLSQVSTITNVLGNGIQIQNNPLLAVCNLNAFCAYLANDASTHPRTIFGNAIGCESITAVKSSCTPCEAPTALTSTGVISNKATINWTSAGSVFDLEWGEKDFTPGTGTKQNGVSAKTYTITGLVESTSYDVYLRQDCTNKQSDWVKLTFTTLSVCPEAILLSDSKVVFLGSQNEVNDFRTMYPNCTRIENSLVIGKLINLTGEVSDITDISPLNNIQSVGETLLIDGTQLTNLNGLSSLKSIDAGLNIATNPQLSNIDGLSSLISIKGGIVIGNNNQLTNLNGLINIQDFQGKINIGQDTNFFGVPLGNSKLNDISALQNINPAAITELTIKNNPLLSVCNIASFCTYLKGSGPTTISGNATGCQDVDTVKTACTAVLATSDINKKGIAVYPNPFTDVINLSDINNIDSITVNDISGKLIKTIKPTKEINFSNNASGTYITNVKFKDGDVKSFKVIKK